MVIVQMAMDFAIYVNDLAVQQWQKRDLVGSY